MDFIMKLIKVFFTSATRQIGRDSGKVVSNKVYGNKNHTNIKIKKE